MNFSSHPCRRNGFCIEKFFCFLPLLFQGLAPLLSFQSLLLEPPCELFATEALLVFLRGTSELLLSEEDGFLLSLLLHANDMKGDTVLATTVIFSEANNALYVTLCGSQERFGLLRLERWGWTVLIS